MKTHHDGVFSSVIDIVEGRMIDTNTLIENDRKEGGNWGWFWLLLKIEGMKEMDDKNDVLEKGRWMNEGMNMMNTK